MAQQGDLSLLGDPAVDVLLRSRVPARLAYTWHDGTPRVVPIWFHWTGEELVFGSPARAPKVRVLRERPDVAVTIDTDVWPYQALSLRGRVHVEVLDHVVPEYELAAVRYSDPEQGRAWADSLRDRPMARIALTPSWVGLIDFAAGRVPSALGG
ncbi:pyridoxamine 5'-phosphate oxidase family protein [Quadrisphaera sp. KR29]|uniref:pyridoxamine 5'-phosphate oxidase family protein n=1 Tax=Quadrisphaera sp. KR29 TaxID=3461391 RepID=UPI0040449590